MANRNRNVCFFAGQMCVPDSIIEVKTALALSRTNYGSRCRQVFGENAGIMASGVGAIPAAKPSGPVDSSC